MNRVPLILFAGGMAVSVLLVVGGVRPAWPLVTIAVVTGALAVHELLGKPLPFLRWSFLRMGLGSKLLTEWQVGDGREEAVARHVIATARPGDPTDALRAIDEFARQRSFLINVGDEKGEILDRAVQQAQVRKVLELGAYVGYSALRIARQLPPGAHLYSVEFSAANAEIARRIIRHAGVEDRVTFVTGTLDDGGKTMRHLVEACGFAPGSLDLVFVDHAKDAYLPDLKRILDAGWLHAGSVVVADNIGFPGAPDYKAYMEAEEGRGWRTTAHVTHLEYQSLVRDIVLESTRL